MIAQQRISGIENQNKRLAALEWLMQNGYHVGTSGRVCAPIKIPTDCIDVFRDNPATVKRTGLRGYILNKIWPLRRELIAVLYLENPARDATMDQWVLEVRGDDRFDHCHNMAKQLGDTCNVPINLIVNNQYERYESYFYDHLP